MSSGDHSARASVANWKGALSKGERCELERRVRRRNIAHADSMRAEIVLLAADGLNNCAIAEEIGACRRLSSPSREREEQRAQTD